jgi:hypothetical protein
VSLSILFFQLISGELQSVKVLTPPINELERISPCWGEDCVTVGYSIIVSYIK